MSGASFNQNFCIFSMKDKLVAILIENILHL